MNTALKAYVPFTAVSLLSEMAMLPVLGSKFAVRKGRIGPDAVSAAISMVGLPQGFKVGPK